jgi:CubicO group peptidase (beta-lactamase class C family)
VFGQEDRLRDYPGVTLDGSCAPGFGKVRDAFISNFTDRDDIGAAVAVWMDDDLVVNLWGGAADAAGHRPWQEDTLASIFSGSKGLTSTCVHLLAAARVAHSRSSTSSTGSAIRT